MRVNDTTGHHAGDVLLQLVAQHLDGLVSRPDVVARLNGDEFSCWSLRIRTRRAAVRAVRGSASG
jgi:diguanylate cyclase (GGDEF)-like protein